MIKKGKRYKKVHEAVEGKERVSLSDALSLVKEHATAKFDETVEVNVNVGIDPSKGDQVVRGSVVLPHGRGKQVKVLVFAKGQYEDEAKGAGADYVGAEDLVEKIKGGWMEFDYAIATPDLMALVSKVAKILGPRGLLPNKKLGTVTFDVASMVKDFKGGRVFFKNNKSGVVNFVIGRASFSVEQLSDNFRSFLKALRLSKPASSKGKFIKKVVMSSTMGVGITIDVEKEGLA